MTNTNKEFFDDMLNRDIDLHKQKISNAKSELEKEFWQNQLNVLLKGIEEFEKKTEGTH